MTEPKLALFEQYRPLMFAIAYRMLGSATDAQDILQEAWLRFQAVDPQAIQSPRAYLSTIVTRLCLNHLESARVRREAYIGPWLPEPILTAAADAHVPAAAVELHESISLAFLALLEQLTPLERAVFLLRQVFDYPYDEIARILERDEAACRQLFSRAKRHISAGRPRFTASADVHRALLVQFIETVQTGDLPGLERLLTEDVTLWTDGGGKARGAALHALRGAADVAAFLQSSLRLAPVNLNMRLDVVNGALAAVLQAGETPFLLLSVVPAGERIAEIRIIGNPDKLTWLKRPIGGAH